MKYWLYCEPVGATSEPVWMIYSEEAIIAEYWEAWERQGIAYNKAHGLAQFTGITARRCIEDWTIVRWAVPATPETLQKIISAPKTQ
jgi:hypothetical protein